MPWHCMIAWVQQHDTTIRWPRATVFHFVSFYSFLRHSCGITPPNQWVIRGVCPKKGNEAHWGGIREIENARAVLRANLRWCGAGIDLRWRIPSYDPSNPPVLNFKFVRCSILEFLLLLKAEATKFWICTWKGEARVHEYSLHVVTLEGLLRWHLLPSQAHAISLELVLNNLHDAISHLLLVHINDAMWMSMCSWSRRWVFFTGSHTQGRLVSSTGATGVKQIYLLNFVANDKTCYSSGAQKQMHKNSMFSMVINFL